jgi:membrane protease YdiL (CAAX protease family)
MTMQPNPRPLWQRYVAVVVYLIASFLLTQIIGLALLAVKPIDIADTQKTGLPFTFLMHSVIVQMAGFLVPAPLLLKFTRSGFFSFQAARLRDILLCCGLTFASLIFFSVLYHALKIEPQQLGFLNGQDILRHKAAFLAITAVAVPAYEEWIFRGLIFGILVFEVEDRRKIFAGAAFCALLFTLSHVEGKHSLSALPPILVMAAIFQYMTWRSQSLWPAIAAHAMQNLMSSFAFFAKFATDAAK